MIDVSRRTGADVHALAVCVAAWVIGAPAGVGKGVALNEDIRRAVLDADDLLADVANVVVQDLDPVRVLDVHAPECSPHLDVYDLDIARITNEYARFTGVASAAELCTRAPDDTNRIARCAVQARDPDRAVRSGCEHDGVTWACELGGAVEAGDRRSAGAVVVVVAAGGDVNARS